MSDARLAPAGAPPAPDRVATLSGRLSEALTAVGIAVRHREAEIELLDRTLAMGAESPAARQAAERMARIRAEHAQELDLLARAHRALEEASDDCGALSEEMEARQRAGEAAEVEAARAQQERSALAAELAEASARAKASGDEATRLERELDEASARAKASGDEAARLERELEEARAAADEAAKAAEKRQAELRSEADEARAALEEKAREAEELARLMGAFSPAEAGAAPGPAAAGASTISLVPPPGAPDEGDADEGDVAAEAADDGGDAAEEEEDDAARDARFEEISLGDEDPILEAPSSEAPPVAAASDDDDGDEPEAPPVLPLPDAELADEEGGAMPSPFPTLAASPPPGDVDETDFSEFSEDTMPASLAPPRSPAVQDITGELSAEDWGEAVVLPEPPPAGKKELDDELRAYLSSIEDDDVGGPSVPPAAGHAPAAPPKDAAQFRAVAGIDAFTCSSPEELRIAGALQIQSWSALELAKIVGLEEQTVRERLAAYLERGLIEPVS